MSSIEKIEDPIWDYVLATKLQPYIPAVRKFWETIEDIQIHNTGVFPVEGTDIPPGLMYRVTNTPVRSPIKNVQVFPFVPCVFLQLTNVAGGAVRMVNRVCAGDRFAIDEFVIIEKNNLQSTYHNGQFVAFVPRDILDGARTLGKWVYLTTPEMCALMNDMVTKDIKKKLVRYV